MPVPLSTTHAQGAGLQAAQHAELPTAGPFARIKQQQIAVASTDASQPAPAAATNGAAPIGTPASPADGPALATNHLNFWYCDIGESKWSNVW